MLCDLIHYFLLLGWKLECLLGLIVEISECVDYISLFGGQNVYVNQGQGVNSY